MVLDGERRGRLASHGLSANLIARQENARQGSRSHFPILVKLFALWWQMLVQTSDITVRSQIAKACAHCRRPDCGCLFRSYAVDIYAIRSFSCLFALWRTTTRHRSTSLELQLPIPGSCCRRPRLFCCQTNVRRKFSQNECLWSLQTSFSRMFGEICFCLLLDTSATATNLLNWTGEASGCFVFFLKRATSFNTWLQRLARKLKNLVLWERISRFFL